MIQCPSCGEEIAENSAHCGYCGAKIEAGSGKQTMIGMAAVSSEDLARVKEETARAREAAEASGDSELGNERSKPAGKLSIPKPGGGSGGSTSDAPPSKPSLGGLAGKLNIPKPGQSATAGAAPPDAKTEMMNAVPGSESNAGAATPGGASIDDVGPTDPMVGGAPSDDWAPADGPPATPPEPAVPSDSFGELPPEGTGPAGAPTASAGGAAEETMKEIEPPSGVSVPESQVSSGPSEFGSGSITVQENMLPEKKSNKTLLIAGVAVFALMFICAVFSTLVWFFV